MQDQERLLLNRYSLEQQLAGPEPLSGRPILFSGHDIETGSGVLVKLWPRRNDGKDLSLQSIWQNEVRQLQRLAGYSGAREYLVTIKTRGIHQAVSMLFSMQTRDFRSNGAFNNLR